MNIIEWRFTRAKIPSFLHMRKGLGRKISAIAEIAL